jgi:NAD(P)-dependent dehydrogenase (short-subunit alcohol dehydrogenase family)
VSAPSASPVGLVTGANTGIGEVAARALAARGLRVVLACRSLDKAEEARKRILSQVPGAHMSLHALDLSSLASVRESAERFLATGSPLAVLVNNAGMAGARGLTVDGFELAFGVNHLGPHLFTRLLEPRLRAHGEGARIVNVASRAHRRVARLDWAALQRPTRSVTGFPEYSVSKLCNVLCSREHARRLEGTGVRTYALHPGVVASDVWRKVPWPLRPLVKLRMISNEEGARTTVYCATSPEVAAQSGLYYDRCAAAPTEGLGGDDALGRELWARCEAWAGLSVTAQ